MGAGGRGQPLEEACVAQRLRPDEVEDARGGAGRTLDRRQHQGDRVLHRDGLQAVRAVARTLDLPPRHGLQEHGHQALPGADDVRRAEDDGFAVGAEERDLGRELREEVAVRAARRETVAGHPQAGEVGEARDPRPARELDRPLGAAQVDGIVGRTAALGPDLGEVHERAAALQGPGEARGIPLRPEDRPPARLAHRTGRALRAHHAHDVPAQPAREPREVSPHEAVGPGHRDALAHGPSLRARPLEARAALPWRLWTLHGGPASRSG